MYKLIIEDDEGKTTVVPLIRDEITIGRKEGNTIRLTERNVSRRHAKLVKSNGSVVIEDLQSYNGIRLNGDRINGRAAVGEGDRIQIGDYQLALKLDKANATDKAAAGVPERQHDEDATTKFDKDADAPTAMNAVLKPDQESPARLAVVSSNFAGQQFVLDKAAVVIGRTDENDVVINHRSISRHHAKIVREGGHYHVVDLQSANGVRVNGEEYGKVELRKGDHIDLGHVRLRFVAPNEDFVFERDAKIVEVAGDKRSKGGLYAIIGVAVILLGIGAVAVVKLMGGKGPEKPAADVEGTIAKINLEVDNAIKALDWDKAVGLCRDGLAKDPTADTLRDKKTRAEAEKRNEEKFQEYTAAAKSNDYDRAVTAYQELPEDSIYHEKAQETYNLIKRAYIKEHLGKAGQAQKASQCEEARKHVEAVLLVDEANAEAQKIAQQCGQTAVAPKRPHDQKPHEQKPAKDHPVAAPVQHVEETPPPRETPKPASPEGDELYAKAMNQYVQGNYSAASDLARKSVAAGNSKAWRLVGASGCFQHNRDDAVKAWNKLGQMDRQFIKYVCNRNNITIP